MLYWIRSWIDHWSWSLHSCWNSCKRAHRTRSPYCFSNSWNCSWTFSILLCGVGLSLSISWECISLFVHMCWRRVSSTFLDLPVFLKLKLMLTFSPNNIISMSEPSTCLMESIFLKPRLKVPCYMVNIWEHVDFLKIKALVCHNHQT